jgi:hypothetical protein
MYIQALKGRKIEIEDQRLKLDEELKHIGSMYLTKVYHD